MENVTQQGGTQWRATHYTPTLASKASLLEESRLFLLLYAKNRNVNTSSKTFLDVLPQRSYSTRLTIVRIIQKRLVRWHPPEWVLADLVEFVKEDNMDALKVTLLLHAARQDSLLYDFIQQVLAPYWIKGTRDLIRSDVQCFLDNAQETHTEITNWSYSTRKNISTNALTILRDFGLLKGKIHKRIVAPIIPIQAVAHLVHLLQEEGMGDEQLALHPDWRLWLWGSTQAQCAIKEVRKNDN